MHPLTTNSKNPDGQRNHPLLIGRTQSEINTPQMCIHPDPSTNGKVISTALADPDPLTSPLFPCPAPVGDMSHSLVTISAITCRPHGSSSETSSIRFAALLQSPPNPIHTSWTGYAKLRPELANRMLYILHTSPNSERKIYDLNSPSYLFRQEYHSRSAQVSSHS